MSIIYLISEVETMRHYQGMGQERLKKQVDKHLNVSERIHRERYVKLMLDNPEVDVSLLSDYALGRAYKVIRDNRRV